MDIIGNDNVKQQLEFAESIIRSTPMKSYEIARSLETGLEANALLECLYIEGKALWLLGRFEEAVVKANQLGEMGGNLDNNTACARSFNIIGNVFFGLGNLDKALENYMKGLSLSRFIEDKLTEGILNNNIGEIYSSLEALDEALNYYLVSLDIAIRTGNYSLISTAYLNLGELYYKRENLDEALKYVKLSIKSLEGIEDYFNVALSHSLLAKIYRLNKNFDDSDREFSLAVGIMHRIEDKLGILKLYEVMISFFIEEKKYEEALDYAEDALEIAYSLNLNNEISEVALLLARIHECTEEYKISLDYYKLYVHNRNLYENESNEKQKKEITTQLSIEKLMHDKEIYRLKNVELRKKSEEIQELYESVRIINDIGRDITSTLNLKKITELIYKNINYLMDASYFGIMLYDEETGIISANLFLENGKPVNSGTFSVDDENSLGAWCIRNEKEIFSNEYSKDRTKYKTEERHALSTKYLSKSVIVLPLVTQGKIIGAVTVQSTKENAYTNYQYNTFKALASYISIAVNNSQESLELELEIKERIKTQNELEILNKKLSEMTYIDALTKIPNRRKFVEYFNHELVRAKRNYGSITLLIIDIDYFKEYNDNYGHVEGDKCIAEVANILSSSVTRENDFVARYGGDEFVVVLTETDLEGSRLIAERIKSNIREKNIEHKYSKVSDILTITLGGITFVPDKKDTMERVIHEADNALYSAKEKGRNRYVFYNEMRES